MVGCQKSAKGYEIFILIKRNIKSRITMNKIGRKYKNTKKVKMVGQNYGTIN